MNRWMTCLAVAAAVGLGLASSSLATAQIAVPPAANPEEKGTIIRGKVDAVTVYRGQALVTRLVNVPGPGGLREIVVTDLPGRVLSGSLYAESADGGEVRSILYRERPVSQDVREDVRKIDDQIKAVNDKIIANARTSQVQQEHRIYLSKLEQFAAPTANVELTKGVLNAETLKQLTTFILDQRQGVAASELKLQIEERDLREQLSLLQRQRQEIASSSSRTVREAVVFANIPANGAKLRVAYLVDSASWEPSYNVRTDVDRKNVSVEYNASIQQQSGEDWGDVDMILSTASPALLAKAPSLTPLAVTLAPGGGTPSLSLSFGTNYFEARKNIKAQRQQAEQERQFSANSSATINVGGGNQTGNVVSVANGEDVSLNKLADDLQVLEILSKDTKPKGEEAAAAQADEGISVNYQLASRTSLPSRSDRQLIMIKSLPMKATFYKVAIPVLTSYVYDEATIANDSKTVLLAGPVASYLGGQFVGRSQVPTVAVGESFSVGFGIDSSMRVGREMLDKTETAQGGNRVISFSYKLTAENFGAAAAKVRLLDRLPTGKDTEVRVTLASTGQELSKDEAYQQSERKKGILRWEVEVPAQAVGPKAFSLEYQFKAEFDRQMAIIGMPAKK